MLTVDVTDSAGHVTSATVAIVIEGPDWNGVGSTEPKAPEVLPGVPWLPVLLASVVVAAVAVVAFALLRRRPQRQS